MALRTPPLREAHAERGAKFTEFGGWDMPVEFDGIRVEHEAVRSAAGLFDVSHMGQIEVSGPDATELTNRLTTNDVAALDAGDAQYAAITDEDGNIIDDTVVYLLPDGETYLFVPNAGGDGEMHERWTSRRDEWGLDAVVANATEEYAMFALQGPDAVATASEAAGTDLDDIRRFTGRDATVADTACFVARTGYTGEDGVEFLLPTDGAEAVWHALADTDGTGVQPCGLGARDTLRIEAGFLLAGQDFDIESNPRTPYEAGIGFAVDLDTEFVGRDALAAATDPEETFVGFKLTERGVPRHGYDVVDTENRIIGEVTSGTMSPTLDEPVGMGYLPTEYADPGTDVRVVVRGSAKNARVHSLPFYEP
ncbi:glycine cleavage system aminomethyltransferase GcvT [Halosegnis marinus]|uniref:Probable aminomethyltransferase n=1 Tax=Halosegnis marinus TaxID=3034023 RepID=A0ABD5ZKG5_9EURY|nr:glycine cleavage system aminomethyltransferase GcvT [Halosegnis sp. DT85]